ncbi:uncharacterized protein LY79DRAFT_665584 [Colletotrichum navitas]|uniref:Uncharacterized protein n=1 Tax=Colletotrichum navitas TaxID=681940 RepID=A0AAD8QB21_9PEZI|nr:uncharacterized protein LY79DRAFT_665584 [Colletotrichum navitas]KAK1599035.1 hypothetical protein LY79DRAFT_665584 [Colletotrichum navitas]
MKIFGRGDFPDKRLGIQFRTGWAKLLPPRPNHHQSAAAGDSWLINVTPSHAETDRDTVSG